MTYQLLGMEIHDGPGRFLPASVYSRWKWTVRFGLLIIPLLVFLSGGVVLFLTPSEYQSSTVVEIKQGRHPAESAELMKSSEVLGRVIDELELAQRMKLDRETLENLLREKADVRVIPETNLIEISARNNNKELARDIAHQIPVRLISVETAISQTTNVEKASKIEQLIRDASDVAAEKAVAVTKLESFHSQQAPDTAATRELERARRTSLVADAEVERLNVLLANSARDSVGKGPKLIVHSAATISDKPSNPKVGAELNSLIIQALISGILVALLLPYILELAFPPVREPFPEPYLADNL